MQSQFVLAAFTPVRQITLDEYLTYVSLLILAVALHVSVVEFRLA